MALIALSCVVVSLSFCPGCTRTPSDFTLDIATLERLNPETTAGITYEEKDGVLLVSVVDRYGDGHVHRLELGDLTRAQARELLRQKQIELGRGK